MRPPSPEGLNLKQRLGFLAGDVFVYGGATAVTQAFGLLTFPLLARHFSVEQYGIIDLFSLVAALVTITIVFGQDSAVARYFYATPNEQTRRQLLSQSLALQLCITALAVPTLWWSSAYFVRLLGAAGETAPLLRLVLLQVPFLVFLSFSQNLLKWTFRRREFLIVSLGVTVASALALVVGALAGWLTVRSVFLIFLVSRVLAASLSVWWVRSWLAWPTGWTSLREGWAYALPYGLISVIGVFTPVLQRSIALEFLGEVPMGLLAAAAKIAMLVALPIAAFQTAWGPFSLSVANTEDAQQTYGWILKIFTLCICTFLLLIGLLATDLIRALASERYVAGAGVVFALSFGLAVQGVGWITRLGIDLSKRSYLHLYAFASYVVFSTGLMYLLVLPFGLLGLAWGGALGHAVKAICETWLAQRVHPLGWPLRAAVSLVVLTAAVGTLSDLARTFVGYWYGFISGAFGIALLWYVAWRTFFSARERAAALLMLTRNGLALPGSSQ